MSRLQAFHPRRLLRSKGEEDHPPVPAQFTPPRRAQVMLAEGSIFECNPAKLQSLITDIDQMDPEIAEKLLGQIETTAELFPKKPAPKIIDNNP